MPRWFPLSRRERQRLCEKLEFLRAGLWDTGLRVKKLKGIGRPVFEARLNRGERILFTLRRPPGGNDEGHGVTRIHLRDLVPHEDVGRALSRIVKAPLLEIERAEVEEMSEFVADDLGDDYFWPALDRPVDAPPTDDAGPEPWLVVDEEELGRLQVVDQGDNLKLYLFLTSEQARLLHSEPPLLLSGTAGSGKTTIAVYFLLRQRVQPTCCRTGRRRPGRHRTGERRAGAVSHLQPPPEAVLRAHLPWTREGHRIGTRGRGGALRDAGRAAQ